MSLLAGVKAHGAVKVAGEFCGSMSPGESS